MFQKKVFSTIQHSGLGVRYVPLQDGGIGDGGKLTPLLTQGTRVHTVIAATKGDGTLTAHWREETKSSRGR